MSDVRIDQAFISDFIAAQFGLPIAYENSDYSPSNGQDYAEIKLLANDTTARSLADSNQTDGVFRVVLRTPASRGSIALKTKATEIYRHYAIGKRLTYDGITVTVVGHNIQPGLVIDGWFVLVTDMRYRCFFNRNEV